MSYDDVVKCHGGIIREIRVSPSGGATIKMKNGISAYAFTPEEADIIITEQEIEWYKSRGNVLGLRQVRAHYARITKCKNN